MTQIQSTSRFPRLGARALALGLAGALLASGLAVTAPTAAHAAGGTITEDTISSPDSPMSMIKMNRYFESTKSAPPGEFAFSTEMFSQTRGTIWWRYPADRDGVTNGGGADNTVTLIKPGGTILRVGGELDRQSYGEGTPENPWVLTRTFTVDNGLAELTRADSYVAGAPSVRSDVTVKNRSSSPLSYAITQFADCYFGGDDSGTNEYGARIATCKGAADPANPTAPTGRITLVDQSGGGQLYLGGGNALRGASRTYDDFPSGEVCPVKNTAANTENTAAACDVKVDNAVAIRWKETIPAGGAVTKTFLSSDSNQMRFADLKPSVSASAATVEYGDTFDYTLSLVNSGLDKATAARASFKLPAGVVFDSATGDGTYDAATGEWAAGDLANQATATMKITVKALAGKLGAQNGQISEANSAQEVDLTECTVAGSAECGATASVNITQTLDITKATAEIAPTEVTANGTSASTVTIRTFDGKGQPMVVSDSADQIALETSFGTLGPVTAATDASGTYTAALTSAVAGVATVTGSFAGTDFEALDPVTFVAGPFAPGASSVVATKPSATANGEDTNTVTLTIKDAQGNPIAADVNNIATSGDHLSFGPWTAGETPGTYTATVTSEKAGVLPYTVTYSDTAFAGDNTLTFTPGPISSTTSVITLDKDTATASGTDTVTATVQLKDALGNNISVTESPVSFTTTRGSLGTVTVNPNGTISVPLTSTTSGAAIIGFTLGETVATSTANATFVAGAFDRTASTATVTTGTVIANGTATHTVTIALTDAQGNPITAEASKLALSASPATGVTLSTPTAGATPGTYTATITSTVAGSPAINVSYDGAAITGSGATVTFVPGPVDLATSTIAVDQAQVVADGQSASTVTVVLKDAQGNVLIPGADDVVITTDHGTLSDLTVNAATGEVTATLTSTTAGSATLGFTVTEATATATATVTFVAGALDPAASKLTVSSGSKVADGTAAHTVTVTMTDAQGNPVVAVPGDFVSTATPATGVTIGAFTAGTAPGEYSATITSTVAGTPAIAVTYRGATVTGSGAKATFVPGPVTEATSTFTVSAATVVADGTASTLTLTLKDAQGNVVIPSADEVALSTDFGDLSEISIDAATGIVTATLSSTATGTASVGYSYAGVTAALTHTVEFTPGPVSVTDSAVTVTPGAQEADGTAAHTVTIKLRDAHGNPVAGAPEDLTASAAPNLGVTFGAWTAGALGTYTASITSTEVSTPAISVAYNGRTVNGSGATVIFVAGAVSGTTSTITVSNPQVVADGTASSTVTVIAKDSHGNTLTPSLEDFVVTASVGVLSDQKVAADGTFTATLTSVDTGVATVSAVVSDVTVAAAETVTFIAGPISAPDSTIVATGGTQIANGIAKHTISVRLTDAHGNGITTDPAGLTASAQPGDGVVFSDFRTAPNTTRRDTGGNYQVDVTSTIAKRVAVSVTYRAATISGTSVDVLFTAGPADPAKSTFEITKDLIQANGTATSVVNVTLQDAQGNRVTPTADQVTLATTAGTLSAITIAEDGTVSATLTATAAGTATITAKLGEETVGTGEVTLIASPTTPVVAETNGKTVSGTADPGAIVIVRDARGNEIARATANEQGEYNLTFSPARVHAEELSFTATDSHGFVSAAAKTVVDAKAPELISLAPTVGTEVSGVTEPGATVEILNAQGTVIGTGKADDKGAFTITLSPAAERGATLGVRLRDALENTSAITSFTVTKIAASALPGTVNPGNEVAIVGTGFQPGEKVTATFEGGSLAAMTGTANDKGIVRFAATLPAGAQIGQWTATLSAEFSGTTTASFTVVAAPVKPIVPKPGTGQGGLPGDPGHGGLPSTGANVLGAAGLGGILLALGAALALRRRRNV